MEKLFLMARAANKRSPEGVEPFRIVTRILEECGEVAAEVNLWEDMGVKRKKHGEPKKENLANEIRQSMAALAQLAIYYHVEQELEESIEAALARQRQEGLIGELTPWI